MTKQISYRINEKIKEEFDSFVIEEHGKNKRGSELERAMRLYLAVYSDKKSNDIEIESLKLKFNYTHTQNSDTNENDEITKETMQKNIVKQQVRYKKNQMDQFVSAFHEEYGDYHQVSMNELKNLVMNVHGVTDPRSIRNRIDYLQTTGYIEPYAPNVYKVKII